MEGLEFTNEKDTSIHSVKDNKMDPSQFDATMKQLLIGQGAEKYVNIFREDILRLVEADDGNVIVHMAGDKTRSQERSAELVGQKQPHIQQHNIGQNTLAVLSEADLLKLGVDDANTRKNIISMVKDLPIFEELSTKKSSDTSQLTLKEITEILTESSDHLNRIYMSLFSTTKALSKEGVSDMLLYEDKYASDVAISTSAEISSILDSMEYVLQRKMMLPTKGNKQKKKIIVGALGSVVIITLAVLFARSLKHLK